VHSFVRSLLVFGVLTSSAASAAPVVFNNGAINGNFGASTISGAGPVAADDFGFKTGVTLLQAEQVGIWVQSGAVPLSLDWAVTDSPGGTILTGGTNVAVTSTFLFNNASSLDVYAVSFSLGNFVLTAGNYWLQLSNVTTSVASDASWDAVGAGNGQLPNDPFPNSGFDYSFRLLAEDALAATSVPEIDPASATLPLVCAGLLLGMLDRRRIVSA
jgi:hypothetical protein